ncbi:MAG: hypothetical protein GYB32_03430 [Algicola sp.]|nr:hypothetical protein [Algicola sp.]
MKKQLLLLTFACFLFAGTQISFAQAKSKSQIESVNNDASSAKKNADKVIQMLERSAKLDAKQKAQVYDIYNAVDKKMQGIDAVKDPAERALKKEKMQNYINSKLKQVLSSEQYEIYMKKVSAK